MGALLGSGLGRLVLHLRRRHHEADGYENFFVLGLIGLAYGLAYGLAVLVHAYGCPAVFAAGLALGHAAQVGTEAASRTLAGSRTSPVQRRLMAWFGIRGIGSLDCLCFAIGHGLPSQHVDSLVGLTLAVVVTSIIVHGVSVTPLMAHYRQRRVSRQSRPD